MNITGTDAPLIKQYFIAIQENDLTRAEAIYNQIPQNNQKILTAEGLNKLGQAITALQRFYKTDIQSYINTKQLEWQDIINQFSYKGTWSASKQYAVNNYVSYTVNSTTQLYVATANPPKGSYPTNSTYWRVLSISGQKGVSGDGLSFMGEWDSQQNYAVDNCVTFSNALWGAIAPSTNQTPYEGSDYWKLIYRGTMAVYPVTTQRPSVQEDGALWFQIV